MGVKSTFSNGVLEEEAWYTRIGSYLKKNGNDEQMIEKFKEAMTQEFEITNLGLMKYFLGLEIRQDNYGIFASHETYAK
ncbi:retrovirus-related pol polyprotein from transposon TNT 1-94 [Tanacetum coccineum]